MNAEFDWWLLLVGVVAGAGLTWLVLADSSRRDVDIEAAETRAEAGWIARTLSEEGRALDADTAEAVLQAHRRYLGLPPPDALVDPTELRPLGRGRAMAHEIAPAGETAAPDDDERVAGGRLPAADVDPAEDRPLR